MAITTHHQRVLFLNTASEKIGMGHLVRDLTLAKVFSEKGSIVSFFSLVTDTALEAIKKRIDLEDDHIDLHRMYYASQVLDMVDELQPRYVIIDGPESFARRICPYIPYFRYSIGLDYFLLEQPLPKLVVNVVDHSCIGPGISVKNERVHIVYREGHEYAIIRDEFIQARKIYVKKYRTDGIRRVLLSFGGADPSGNTFKALDFIWKNFDKVEVVVIAGPLMQENHANDFTEWKTQLNLDLKENVHNLADEMLASDIIFCGAGTTLLEAMCVGIPAIVIPQTQHEKVHAEILAAKGGCILLSEITSSVNLLGKLETISNKARSLIDGGGKMRIYQLIQSHGYEEKN